MFFRTPSTTLLQIFSKLMLYSKVIFKSMESPDDTRQVEFQDSRHEWVRHISIGPKEEGYQMCSTVSEIFENDTRF